MAVRGSDRDQILSIHITRKLAWRNYGKPLKTSSRVKVTRSENWGKEAAMPSAYTRSVVRSLFYVSGVSQVRRHMCGRTRVWC
jgi:hypothetical protein